MFWDLEKKSAFISRDVVFNEELILQEKSKMEDKSARWSFRQFNKFSEQRV